MATRGKRGSRGHFHGQGPTPKTNRPEVPSDVDLSSPVVQTFLVHRGELDNRHDKYERLVKSSRDITIASKRVIFLLHRAIGDNKGATLKDASEKITEIQDTLFRKIAEELCTEDPHQFTRAYSPGVQEYIEAVSFRQYLDDGSLVSLADVEKDLVFTKNQDQQTQTTDLGGSNEEQLVKKVNAENASTEQETIKVYVSPVDYVLGLADLTGELMRLAITSIGNGNIEIPFEVCGFMRQIHDAFVSLGNINRELPRKLNVLKQSLRKVENACYTIQVRGSEFPKSMLLDMISTVDSGPAGDSFE